MIKQMIINLKETIKNFDNKIKKILQIGLNICFFIAVFSIILLSIYLFLVHSQIIYEIGILVFQISLYYTIFFICSAITVDSINKNIV